MILWKYAIWGMVGKGILILSGGHAQWWLWSLFIIPLWWGYLDITRYLAERKLKRDAKQNGNTE